MRVKRILITLCVMALNIYFAFAQGGGRNGLEAATNEIKGYFDSAVKLMYAIATIIGIIGAIRVYNKFQQGDGDVGKAIAAWGGGCLFVVVVAVILRGFFGT